MFLAYALAGGVAAASFVSTMILARLAGAAVIGDYALALSTANLLASFAMLGLDRILIREVAGDLRQGDGARAAAGLRAITRTIAATALLTTCLYAALVLGTPLLLYLGGGGMRVVIVSALLWPLLRAGTSGLRGSGHPVLGQLFEALPSYFFMATMLLLWLFNRIPDAAGAVSFMVAAQVLAAIGAWLLLSRRACRWGRPDPSRFANPLLLAGLPVMGSLFLQLFADWLLLARLSSTMGAADTGAFRVAIQLVTIITTLVVTTESFVSAEIAAEFRSGRPDRAWAVHRKATLLMLGLTAPIFLLLWRAPGRLLGLLYGPDFAIAAPAIVILAIGQLGNVLRGPLGAMFVMSGNQRTDLALTLGSMVFVIGLALLLIPAQGLAGAAIAQISGLLFRAGVGYVVARRMIPNRPDADSTRQSR